MTNRAKISKLKADNERLSLRISDYQKRIAANNKDVVELENTEIIGKVRTLNLTLEELDELLASTKAKNKGAQNEQKKSI